MSAFHRKSVTYDRLKSSHKGSILCMYHIKIQQWPHAGNVYTKRLNTRSLKLVRNCLCVAVTWSRNCHKYVVSDAPKTERLYGIVEFNVPLNTVQVIKQNEAAFFATYEFIRLDHPYSIKQKKISLYIPVTTRGDQIYLPACLIIRHHHHHHHLEFV